MQINLDFPFPPVAKERPRLSRYGTYTPARTKEFERQVQLHARRMFTDLMLEVPLRVDIEFHLPKPKRTKFGYWPAVRPDLDNFIKAILDALNGIVWKDDALICSLFCTKVYAPQIPRIKIKIETL